MHWFDQVHMQSHIDTRFLWHLTVFIFLYFSIDDRIIVFYKIQNEQRHELWRAECNSLQRESERKREKGRKIEMEKKVTQQENNCSLIQLSWSIARGDNIHRSRWCCCFDKNLRSLWQFDFIAHCTMNFYFVAYLELLSGRARVRHSHTIDMSNRARAKNRRQNVTIQPYSIHTTHSFVICCMYFVLFCLNKYWMQLRMYI